MNLNLKGKRALVTGAGRGIGSAIVKSLAEEGVEVTFTSRNLDNLHFLHNSIGGYGNGHMYFSCDLSETDSVTKVVGKVEKIRGADFGFDILINNVGDTLGITDPLCSTEDWDRVFRLNFNVAVELSAAVIPNMKKRECGRIVNISSTAGMENNGPVPYCAAKAALIAYSRSMGRVLAKTGVVMSCVLPGAVYTDGGFWDEALRERPEHVEKYLEDRCPTGQLGDVTDISEAVTFLCSDKAKFFQGSIIPIDGGQSRHYFIKP